jgi:hypothetical protein
MAVDQVDTEDTAEPGPIERITVQAGQTIESLYEEAVERSGVPRDQIIIKDSRGRKPHGLALGNSRAEDHASKKKRKNSAGQKKQQTSESKK